ncbi:hypothetical protein ABIA33_006219 [Streptacidiphilus sp. MAP12-16]
MAHAWSLGTCASGGTDWCRRTLVRGTHDPWAHDSGMRTTEAHRLGRTLNLSVHHSIAHGQTIPRCIASHTAVLSRTPSRSAAPQCAIHTAMPSAVPEA